MSLLWALPVLVLVLGSALVGVLLNRFADELRTLDRSLRRAGRIGVQMGSLHAEVAELGGTATDLAARLGSDVANPAGPAAALPDPTGPGTSDR